MNRKGFTLVELLAVIIIVAFLASILLPAMNKAKMKQKAEAENAPAKTTTVIHGIGSGRREWTTTNEVYNSGSGYVSFNDDEGNHVLLYGPIEVINNK